MAKLIAAADSTEINALVLDMKDEFGLNYKTQNPEFKKNAGTASTANVAALLDTLKKHNILAIARIVVFKDSVTARVHPEWTIRKTDGSIWRDKKGLAWVNPYHKELWDYNIGVAEELVKMGFGEVQFDYIRFPEPYPSLPKQVFPGSDNLSKPDGARAVPQGSEDAPQQARRAIDRRHLRSRDDRERRARGGPGLGEDLAERGRRAADGVSVALSARRAGHRASERRAVQGDLHGDLSRARA